MSLAHEHKQADTRRRSKMFLIRALCQDNFLIKAAT